MCRKDQEPSSRWWEQGGGREGKSSRVLKDPEKKKRPAGEKTDHADKG